MAKMNPSTMMTRSAGVAFAYADELGIEFTDDVEPVDGRYFDQIGRRVSRHQQHIDDYVDVDGVPDDHFAPELTAEGDQVGEGTDLVSLARDPLATLIALEETGYESDETTSSACHGIRVIRNFADVRTVNPGTRKVTLRRHKKNVTCVVPVTVRNLVARRKVPILVVHPGTLHLPRKQQVAT